MSAEISNLVQRIATASAGDLLDIRRHELPHLVGITDKQRAGFSKLILKRFEEITTPRRRRTA